MIHGNLLLFCFIDNADYICFYRNIFGQDDTKHTHWSHTCTIQYITHLSNHHLTERACLIHVSSFKVYFIQRVQCHRDTKLCYNKRPEPLTSVQSGFNVP